MTSIQLALAKILAVVLILLAMCGACWHYGAAHVQAKWDAQIMSDQQSAMLQQIHVDMVSQQSITQYVDRVQVVLTEGATITKEITRVITAETDHRYLVPVGLVRVFNASASGTSLDGKHVGPPDESPSGIAMSSVASAINDNFTLCRANAEQLSALQDRLRKIAALNKEKAP